MSTHQKQPKGMFVLGFAEVFERLSYYTLAFLLVLYASETTAKGGLGWSKEQALSLSGVYTMAAFTLPLIGGLIADKFMGTFRAAVFGAILIIMGHATFLFASHEHVPFVFVALSLTATGTAFFKPSMPTLLGRLYTPTDARRDGGFKLYYMGINIGAMIAGFLGGILLQNFGYRIALSSAGIGMCVGLIVLFAGKKFLITDDKYQETLNKNTQSEHELHSELLKKRALKYLMLSFVFYAVWAIIYNLAISGTLSIYIENYTQKVVFGYDIPTPFFQSLESIGIIVSAPILAFVFHKLAQKGKPFHFFSQMNLAVFLIFLAIAYFTHLTSIISEGIPAGTKPFGWEGFAIFILVVSVSEVLISPVMMSSISILAPAKSKTIFQAFYLMVIGLMGLVASKIGAISLSHPYQTFLNLSIVTFVALVVYTILRKKMVSVALEAAADLHLDKKEN
jgi:POT family proton-dependent oligopeptide transporter